MRAGNPYRIPKPKEGVFWKGTFRPADENGSYASQGMLGAATFRARLTVTHLWLSDELPSR